MFWRTRLVKEYLHGLILTKIPFVTSSYNSVLSTSTTPRVSTTTTKTTSVTSTTKTTSTTSGSTITTTRVSTTTLKPKPLCDDIDYYELNDPNRNVNHETHSNGWCDVSGSGNCQRNDELGS